VNSTGGFGAFFLSDTTLTHVEIDTAVATNNLTLTTGAVVERVIARSSTDSATAIVCNNMQGTIRDSACLSSGDGATAVGASVLTPVSSTNNLRNVTATSTGSGSFGLNYFYSSLVMTGPTVVISAKAVIAQGTTQDVRARAGMGTSTTINLDHSNYDTADTQVTSTGTASVTPPGTGAPNFNVTAAPLLAADGYHQLTGSPTIDAGATDGSSGMTDIDGQARTFGSAADIGADEVGDLDGDGLLDTADNCPGEAGPASNGGCPLPVVNPPVTTTPLAPSTTTTTKKKKCKKKKRGAAAARKRCKKRK
jgi:hypothetical protein